MMKDEWFGARILASILMLMVSTQGCQLAFRFVNGQQIEIGASSLTAPGSLLVGGSPLTVNYTLPSDFISGTLEFAADGVTFGLVTALTAGSSSYLWTVPTLDVTNARLRISYVDSSGAGTVETGDFTIDSTAPSLASVTVSNGSPTAFRDFTLTHTSAIGPYGSYCINENDTVVGNCSWITGTLPSTYRVDATPEVKVLSVWMRDAAGNISVRRDSNSVTYDPSATFSLSPATWTAALSNTTAVIPSARALAETIMGDDGLVYLIGGFYDSVGDTTGMYSMAEVHAYNPTSEQWKSKSPMSERRNNFRAVKLSDGRIWVAGGLRWTAGGYTYLSSAEIYDPVADTWTKRASLPEDRYRFTATRFTAADGSDRIAVIGGKRDISTPRNTIYIYDPANDSWTSGPTMTTPRSDHVAVTMTDGKIFIAGGLNVGPLLTYGIYDPLAGTWTNGVNSMTTDHPNGAGRLATAASTGFASDVILLFGGGVGTGMSPNNAVDMFDVATGTWSARANMSAVVGAPQIVSVGGDRFLRVGGDTGAGNNSGVEEYDVSANTWTAKASLPLGRGHHRAILLPSNRVLVSGGTASGWLESLPKNYLYTQGSPGSWAETGHFQIQSEGYNAIKLADGRVLKCGGYSVLTASVIRDCYRFEPSTGNWDTVGKMVTARKDFTLTLLPSGNVLAAGGAVDGADTATNTAELYDATTGVWTATGSFTNARRHHRSVLLASGLTVLLTGGNNGATTGGTYFTNAQRYSIASGTWSAAGTMNENRGNHAQALLNDGRVFAAGGFNGASTNLTAETYNPTLNTWTAVTSASVAHGAASTAHLGTGVNERVYVIGGFISNGGAVTAVNEYYDVTTNAWVTQLPLATGRWGMGTVLSDDGFIYVVGGQLNSVSGGTPTTEVRRFNVAGNTWSSITPVNASQTADLRYQYSLAVLLDDGRMLIPGLGGNVRSSELYSFVTTQIFSAAGGDLDHTLSLFSGIGTFYPQTKLYVPHSADFSARGGSGSTTTRIRLEDGTGLTRDSDITIP